MALDEFTGYKINTVTSVVSYKVRLIDIVLSVVRTCIAKFGSWGNSDYLLLFFGVTDIYIYIVALWPV